MAMDHEHEPELDYVDDEEEEVDVKSSTKKMKGKYISIHSSGFRDFLLKPELLRAITDCGFEHPSEVQHECIPQAVLSMDVLCQAKSGMGKTAVFVLSTLQQIDAVDGQVSVLVLAHIRELAFQIGDDYRKLSRHLPNIKISVFFGGISIKNDEDTLSKNCPNIVIGTPGRILALVKRKSLQLNHLRHFILDECDKMLTELDMRKDVQEIFTMTPREKQVMMFSATLQKEVRAVCKRFMQDVIIIWTFFFPFVFLKSCLHHYDIHPIFHCNDNIFKYGLFAMVSFLRPKTFGILYCRNLFIPGLP